MYCNFQSFYICYFSLFISAIFRLFMPATFSLLTSAIFRLFMPDIFSLLCLFSVFLCLLFSAFYVCYF